MLVEINIDGLVGPSHHFGGLGVGNVASHEHQNQESHPRQAAIEGLQKAWLLKTLGVPQFVFLPPFRPRLGLLTELGFQGTIQEQLAAAREDAPQALSAAFSSAFMWMANAATVTAASDSIDGRLHCTPANLTSSWHRASEAAEREPQLASLLAGIDNKQLHRPLPSILPLRDEGDANHMRLCDASGRHGFNVFVYGADDSQADQSPHTNFLPRHTRAASQAIARLHQLPSDRTFFLQQHPQAIDAGVFHNDVIATSCDHMLIHHELAFLHGESELNRLEFQFAQACRQPLMRIVISNSQLPLADAVRSYLFNSQIVKPAVLAGARADSPRYILICPHHCEEIPAAKQLIASWLADPHVPIDEVHFVRLAESMANGGGPACLRLRMMLESDDVQRLSAKYQLTAALFDRLSAVIERWYPTQLSAEDLCNSEFLSELKQIDYVLRALVA
jgi:succinylarginine dihydrolase